MMKTDRIATIAPLTRTLKVTDVLSATIALLTVYFESTPEVTLKVSLSGRSGGRAGAGGPSPAARRLRLVITVITASSDSNTSNTSNNLDNHNNNIFFSCRNARQGDAHCRRTNSIMQQDPPPSRAPREPIPLAAEPAFICAWPPQGGDFSSCTLDETRTRPW